MKYLSLRQIQQEELGMLKNFIAFCEKNNLTYFLYGGTALGAIRHKGFIPWDDDIDVIMPRQDYESLLSLISRGCKIDKDYIVEAPEISRKTHALFAKIYNTKIKVKANNNIDDGFLWIDIMQLDGLPENYNKYIKKLVILREIWLKKVRQIYKRYYKEKSKLHNYLIKIKRMPLGFISYRLLTKYIINYCKKYPYETAKYVCNNAWYTTPSKIFKKEWFRDAVKVQFEDIEANVCIDYDKFLSKRYGKKYMEIPPKREQITHSFKAWRVEDEK